MDRKEKMSSIFTAAWGLLKKLGFENLSDEKWEQFCSSQDEILRPKNSDLSGAEYRFAKAVLMAMDNYYREIANLQEFSNK